MNQNLFLPINYARTNCQPSLFTLYILLFYPKAIIKNCLPTLFTTELIIPSFLIPSLFKYTFSIQRGIGFIF